MCPSGIQLRFLLSSLVNGCLFSQSGFHVFPDVHHHILDGTSPSRVTHFPFMSPYLWRIMTGLSHSHVASLFVCGMLAEWESPGLQAGLSHSASVPYRREKSMRKPCE